MRRRTRQEVMNRTLTLLALVLLTTASHAQVRDVPRFRVDPSWPTIPNNWQFGQVSSVSIDAQAHVWVLQRPETLAADDTHPAVPPVIEFAADGKCGQRWGAPGPGY